MRGGDLAIRQARDTTTQGRSHTVAIAVTTNNDKKGAWSGSNFLFPLSFLPVPLRGVRLGGTKSLGLTIGNITSNNQNVTKMRRKPFDFFFFFDLS